MISSFLCYHYIVGSYVSNFNLITLCRESESKLTIASVLSQYRPTMGRETFPASYEHKCVST